jgi:hypothetical protein
MKESTGDCKSTDYNRQLYLEEYEEEFNSGIELSVTNRFRLDLFKSF